MIFILVIHDILFEAGLAKLKADILNEDPSMMVCVLAVNISDIEIVREVGIDTLGLDNTNYNSDKH